MANDGAGGVRSRASKLGFRFSPRIADIGGARYWRIDPSADYGELNGVARHQIKPNLIRENRDDALRLAGSLKLGVVQATSIMKTLRIDDPFNDTSVKEVGQCSYLLLATSLGR